LSMKAKLDVSEKRPALSRGIGSRLTTTHRYGNGNGNGNGMQSVHVAPAEMKLEFIIVCRFAKLSTEEQSIIRTASIAGKCTVCMCVCMYVCTYVCMYVCTCSSGAINDSSELRCEKRRIPFLVETSL
jgi:hypothetical protein